MSENKHNDFFVDSGKLSEAALNRKHSLENDPSSRTSIYHYLPTQEKSSQTSWTRSSQR